MPAFTYERDLDPPVSAEVEQSIRATVEPLLHSQGLDRIQVIPGLDHDGDPVLYVELHFELVEQQGLLEVCPSSPGWVAAPTVLCAGTASAPWPPSPPPRLLLQAI